MRSAVRVREVASEFFGRLGGRDFVTQGKPLFVATALASLAVYGFHFFVSRRLGVDDYGTVASLLSAVTLVNAVSAVGATIIARFSAEFHTLEDGARLRRLLDLLMTCCAVLFSVATVAAFFGRVPLAAFLRIGSPELIVLAVVLAALTVAAVLLRGLLQGMQRFSSFSLSFITEQVGRAVVASIFVAIGLGVRGALLGGIIAAAGAVWYTYAGLRCVLRDRAAMLRIDVRRLVMTSGAIAIAALSLAILSYFDLILAKHYLSPRDAGLYGFAVLPGRALTAVISFVPTWILPKSTEHAAGGKNGHAPFLMGIVVGAALGLPAVVLLYVFAPAIVHVIAGRAFAGAAPLIFPYGCAAALYTLTSIAASYQMGRHSFGFVIPLLVAVAGEIAAIAFMHRTAQQIVMVVLVANVAALAAIALPMAIERHKGRRRA